MSHAVADPRRANLNFVEVADHLFGRERAEAIRRELGRSRGPERSERSRWRDTSEAEHRRQLRTGIASHAALTRGAWRPPARPPNFSTVGRFSKVRAFGIDRRPVGGDQKVAALMLKASLTFVGHLSRLTPSPSLTRNASGRIFIVRFVGFRPSRSRFTLRPASRLLLSVERPWPQDRLWRRSSAQLCGDREPDTRAASRGRSRGTRPAHSPRRTAPSPSRAAS